MDTFDDVEIPAIVYPFGILDQERAPFPGYDIQNGISVQDCAPNGKLTRHKFNTIGYIATMGSFLDRAGYQPGFDFRPASGYPKGAILTSIKDNRVVEYLNTVEANTYIPTIIDRAEESSGWVPVWNDKQFDFFPNFDDRTVLKEMVVTSSSPSQTLTLDGGVGWYLITRTVENWDDLTDATRAGAYFDIRIMAMKLQSIGTEQAYEWEYNQIHLYEGQTATRIIPVTGQIKISIPAFLSSVGPVSIQVVKFGMEEIS